MKSKKKYIFIYVEKESGEKFERDQNFLNKK